MRRFHGTLDATLMVRWAHFCVAFVEAFGGSGTAARVPARGEGGGRSQSLSYPTAAAAVLALQAAQETATADELMACMVGYIDPATAAYFVQDATGTGAGCDPTLGHSSLS
jgi:hypothetical protein